MGNTGYVRAYTTYQDHKIDNFQPFLRWPPTPAPTPPPTPPTATPAPTHCCKDPKNALCLACLEGKSVEKYCKKNQGKFGCSLCCKDNNNALCLACSEGKSVKKYCKKYQGNFGCMEKRKKQTKKLKKSSIENNNEDDDEPA